MANEPVAALLKEAADELKDLARPEAELAKRGAGCFRGGRSSAHDAVSKTTRTP